MKRNDMSTTRITATGRLLTCAALALGLTGLGATVALASDPATTKTRDVNNEWTGTDTNPCNNDAVDLEGKEVLRTKETQSSNGKYTFKSSSHQTGSGTVAYSPNRYKYSNFTENEFRTTACKFTTRFENRKHIKRVDTHLGPYDFFLHHMETQKYDSCRVVQVAREKTHSRCK